MEMNSFGITEIKLYHFHRIFKNGGRVGGGGSIEPMKPLWTRQCYVWAMSTICYFHLCMRTIRFHKKAMMENLYCYIFHYNKKYHQAIRILTFLDLLRSLSTSHKHCRRQMQAR